MDEMLDKSVGDHMDKSVGDHKVTLTRSEFVNLCGAAEDLNCPELGYDFENDDEHFHPGQREFIHCNTCNPNGYYR